jgi:hypothetical protein
MCNSCFMYLIPPILTSSAPGLHRTAHCARTSALRCSRTLKYAALRCSNFTHTAPFCVGRICGRSQMLDCFRACHRTSCYPPLFLCAIVCKFIYQLKCALKQTNPFNPAFPLVFFECLANDGKSLEWAWNFLRENFRRPSRWVEGCNEPPAVPTPSGGSLHLFRNMILYY